MSKTNKYKTNELEAINKLKLQNSKKNLPSNAMHKRTHTASTDLSDYSI